MGRTADALRERAARTINRRTGRWRPGSVRFRKHRWPCGQPAVVGGMVCFRPVPSQAGHCTRRNATPSDLPFKSTGFAIYPLPPQFWQSSGANPLPPHCWGHCLRDGRKIRQGLFYVTNPEQDPIRDQNSPIRYRVGSTRDGTKLTTTAFDVGVLLLNATLPIGSNTLASGK